MNIATIHCLHYIGQESKKQFAVYDLDTQVTLKQGQGHQTWYELRDLKQLCNHAKFDIYYFYGVS